MKSDAVRTALNPLLEQLAGKRETAGVCVLGSFAASGIRPDADTFSDFDIALFIDIPLEPRHLALPSLLFQSAIQELLPAWLPNFKFIYPEDIDDPESHVPSPLQINIHQLVLSYEEQETTFWPPDRREAFATTCDIVYDPSGRVTKLIKAKSKIPETEINDRITNALAIIPITIEHSLEKGTQRRLLGDAVLALAEIVDHLLDLVYAINGRDTPHRKWRLKILATLPQLPKNFRERIEKILTTTSESPNLMLKKTSLIKELFVEVKDLASAAGYEEKDPYRQLVTEVRPGFQLRSTTTADKRVGVSRDQYEKMRDPEWNRLNFNLAE